MSPKEMVVEEVVKTDFAAAEVHYKNFCAGCHGEQMQAFVDRQWKKGNSQEQIFASIKQGIPDDGMPAYDTAFTDQEIMNLAAYIRSGIAKTDQFKFGEIKLTSNIVATDEVTIELDTMVYNVEVPWSMQVLKDGTMFYTERQGTLTMLKPDKTKVAITGVPAVRNRGQGGLLEIELHPDFENNQMLFLSYSKMKMVDGKEMGTTAVIKAKLSGNALTNVEEIFEALPYKPTAHHYGCKLEFDKNGYLFISVGERGFEKEHPQFLDNHCGKVHRIKIDGTIPEDNPFVNSPGSIKSIYTYGNRNPQGLAVNPVDGKLWESEHGPRGGDEVNLMKPGHNYGWPVISYGINYNGTTFTDKTALEGMDQPITYFVPSIAASGMTFVNSDRYPMWKGNILLGSLRFNYLHRLVMKGDEVVKQELMLKNIGRMRDVTQGRDGYIYVSVERPGAIYKLKPKVRS
ncbi:MAG: PQQ-dependent sugar dehydrogenase [Saprospiraceae bacterium]|nr:PQQ-dependent sugar dehydrogenase [Saprospiraceae bacterium]